MKTTSKFLALMLALVMVFSTAFVPANAAKIKVKKVSVSSSLSGSKKTVIVAKGKSVKLSTTVTVTPNKKANKQVSYSSKKNSIATVSSKGVVTGKKVGTTTVTVTSKKNKKKKASITVKVVKGAVKKVTLNKKKASMNVGDTLKLKTTVKADKGAVKTIAYTSSKPKVAKVNKKGTVTAVAKGSATITAQAIDGSGKKATCKVSVANPINLAGMDIPNERTVSFSLDKPMALEPDAITISRKVYVSGEYNSKLTLNNLTSADNQNYTAVLSNSDSIYVGNFVRVAIPSLTGTTKSLEMEYKDQICAFTDEEISKWTVGTYRIRSFSFGSRGYSTYSLSGVPAGLTYEIKNNEIKVKGTPTTPGTFDFVLTARDELGNTLNRTIHFIIGSDTVIAGAGNTFYNVIGTEKVTLEDEYYSYIYLQNYFTGGSSNYNYTVVADPQGCGAKVDDEYTYRLYAEAAVAGTYTVTVRATDKENPALFCDVNFVWNVQQGISIGGCLKDAQGNPMPKGTITFTNKDRAAKCTNYKYAYCNSETSTYSAILEPGVYDIEASYNDGYNYNDDPYSELAQSTTYLYAQSLTTTQTGYDIQLPDLYKVVLTADESTDIRWTNWYFNHEPVGSGSTLYLKPGTYTIDNDKDSKDRVPSTPTGNWFNGTTTTYTTTYSKLAASFTIANAAVSAPVTKTETKPSETETVTKMGAKDTTNEAFVGIPYDIRYYDSYYGAYKFTPTEGGQYKITSDYEIAQFYDMSGNLIEKNNGTYELTAGTTYILAAGETWTDYDVKISKVVDTPTTPDSGDEE